MSRRRAIRRPRRVQVNFWKQGEPTSYIGYTTNISMTGMFVATNSPMPSGTRVRIEVTGERGFMVEAVVAHARKIRSDLSRVSQSGMGVHFLSVQELIAGLVPTASGQTEEIPRNADRSSASASPPPPIAEPPAPGPAGRPEVSVRPEPVSEPAALGTAPESIRPSAAAPAPAKPMAASGGTFTLRFADTEEFLEVYRRDILQGGLFLSTLYPARLQETVHVELIPPAPFAQPVPVRARVVQRFEPDGAAAPNPNLLAGMGLELLDLPALVARLRPIVEGLRG